MVKVIEIKKKVRSTLIQHLLVVLGKKLSNNIIDGYVEEWCEDEPSGIGYGYTYKWSIVEDKELINSTLKDRIKIIECEIKELKTKKRKMETALIKKIH